MKDRTLLCVSDGSQTLGRNLDFMNCNILHVTSISDAITVELGQCAVGVILCSLQLELSDVSHLLTVHRSTVWIAIVPSHVLTNDRWRTVIATKFHDYHTLPLSQDRFAHTIGHAWGLAYLRKPLLSEAKKLATDFFTGSSPAIMALRSHLAKLAKSSAPVLISGESGSGKEIAATALHQLSGRQGAFVAINCGAIPAMLIQSELFGYVSGAFTGANKDHCGLIESAQGGTIFFDEIADLPLEQQANLLRFLQEGTIYRIGAVRAKRVDVRVVAASHIPLADAVAAGRFRHDLYYRLNVLPVEVPPLRERRDDLLALATQFFERHLNDGASGLVGFTEQALEALRHYAWPGNVREMINRIRRAIIMAEGPEITVEDLALIPAQCGRRRSETKINRSDRESIRHALALSNNNISQAARELGVSRMTLYRLIAKHEIDVA